ncbi:uncharacterized protein OCT59_007578 [Rhizophagus irregularis]|uniref:uncharacterized protein n=1 Tax=Rhizophagus irregularis TaxID=588596 RepID=UPI000CC7D47F|nr:hypothetical protein OCT59_007578 [Rhizophagus irregularis]GBC33411.1 hypothetical protein GLOIN_2v1582282 [Rhizophagus irregularis DAOM 181602=DAOM 197198]CAB5185182.1 unnamed protein product [Rhizophagus irregularis]
MSLAKARKGLKTAKKGGILTDQQKSVNEFLRVPKSNKTSSRFSPFNRDQIREAYNYCAKFMKIANENPDNPIEKVLEYANEATETTDPELIRYALMSFITHHPSARNRNLRIPPLIQRSPESCVPQKKPGPVVSDEKVGESEGDIEYGMNWYREDPNLSEHHEHWHIVYSGQGIPDYKNPDIRVNKDRHGELFVYMHRQMLARYDIERLGMNLPLIKPLDNYRAPIEEGYKPNTNLRDRNDESVGKIDTFGSREPNSALKLNKINELEKKRKVLEKAIEMGKLTDDIEITVDLLGAFVEPSNIPGIQEMVDKQGGLHGDGHGAIGDINDDDDPGVMTQTRVAVRDPAFWRWHRHIDNLINTWEEKQEPNDFSNSPPVGLQDIILVFKDKLPINHGETQDDEAAAFGEKTFGGENFDTDVSDNKYVTHELQTKMKSRIFVYTEDSQSPEKIDYLYPREFYYYFRVENTSSCQFEATFRVFIVPEELVESRCHWIELDKFKESLPPNSKTVVCRDCDMSSIVRQPPQKTEDELDDTALPTGTGTTVNKHKSYCDCGWPFHLLLPRGRRGGMKFKLLVFISDWSEDEVPRISRCGSISFCASEASEKYPDKKPMGYPFDRPFKNNSYEETFAGLNNVVIRDICINWVDEFPEVVVEGC